MTAIHPAKGRCATCGSEYDVGVQQCPTCGATVYVRPVERIVSPVVLSTTRLVGTSLIATGLTGFVITVATTTGVEAPELVPQIACVIGFIATSLGAVVMYVHSHLKSQK